MKTKDLIAEANSLPINDRAFIVDSLLKSLNVPEKEIDLAWTKIAGKRLAELRSGKVKAISGKAVFNKIFKESSK